VLRAALDATRRFGAARTLAIIESSDEADRFVPTSDLEKVGRAKRAVGSPNEDYKEREARRWKEIRARFLAQHKSVRAPELAELTGSGSVNRSSRAHTWSSKGLIFSVSDGSSERYPLFQLTSDGIRPRPVIKAALDILRPKLSDWQVAIWFTSPNAWLGDWRCPIDLLEGDTDAVVEAARHEVAEQVL
jgi:hypothetical protein